MPTKPSDRKRNQDEDRRNRLEQRRNLSNSASSLLKERDGVGAGKKQNQQRTPSKVKDLKDKLNGVGAMEEDDADDMNKGSQGVEDLESEIREAQKMAAAANNAGGVQGATTEGATNTPGDGLKGGDNMEEEEELFEDAQDEATPGADEQKKGDGVAKTLRFSFGAGEKTPAANPFPGYKPTPAAPSTAGASSTPGSVSYAAASMLGKDKRSKGKRKTVDYKSINHAHKTFYNFKFSLSGDRFDKDKGFYPAFADKTEEFLAILQEKTDRETAIVNITHHDDRAFTAAQLGAVDELVDNWFVMVPSRDPKQKWVWTAPPGKNNNSRWISGTCLIGSNWEPDNLLRAVGTKLLSFGHMLNISIFSVKLLYQIGL